MHILITGAAGMVGRKLADKIVADGGLNGKYAEVIFRDYVASATAPPTIEGITGAELSTDQ